MVTRGQRTLESSGQEEAGGAVNMITTELLLTINESFILQNVNGAKDETLS